MLLPDKFSIPIKMKRIYLTIFLSLTLLTAFSQRRQLSWTTAILDGTASAGAGWNGSGDAAFLTDLTLGTSAAGAARTISADGSAANVSLSLQSKGTGTLAMAAPDDTGLIGISIGLTNGITWSYDASGFGFIRSTSGIGGIGHKFLSSDESAGFTGDIWVKTGTGTAGNASSGNLFFDTGAKNGTGTVGNIGLFTTTATFSAGEKVLFLGDATTAVTSNPTGGVILESLSGVLNIRDASGQTQVTKTLTNTATLDFPSTIATAVADLTITVTGAALGDDVAIGVPNGSVTATATFTAWVSATNTVTIRFSPKGIEDPASGTFSATVIKN